MSHKQPLFLVVWVLLLLAQQSFANQCTWTGSIDSLWNKSGNWNGGIPSGNDTVTIDAGSGVVCLVANVSISRLILNSGFVRLQTYIWTVNAGAEIYGGDILGAASNALRVNGSGFIANSALFHCQLKVVCSDIQFLDCVFYESSYFEKTGNVDSYCKGGNHFYSVAKFKNKSTGVFSLAEASSSTYDDDVYFEVSNPYEIIVSNYGASYFNGDIYLKAYGGTISIGNTEASPSVLAAGGQLLIDSSFNNGTLVLVNFIQSGTTVQDFTVGGSSGLINMVQCSFSGKSTFTSAAVLLRECEFNDSLYVEKTGNSNDACSGNNRYNSTFYFKNSGTGEVILAKDNGDYYTGNATFHTSSTGKIRACYSAVNTFENNLTSTGTKVELNNNNNYLHFTGSADQHLTGTDSVKVKRISLDKTSGYLYVDTTLVIYDSLLLGQGIIYTNNPLVLAAGSAVSGASNLCFVDGPVKKIGNTAFVFPVGDEGQWNPLEITAPSTATDAFTARFNLKKQDYGENKDTTIYLINTCSYWDLTRATGSSNVYVYLYWDSIACGIYDTTGLAMCGWNGTMWKNLGNDTIIGNYLAGKIKNDTLTSYYSAFSWCYKLGPEQPVIQINPTLNATSSTSWNHPISEDYFGYNGANVLFPGQYWDDLSASNVLKNKGITNLRFQGGTVGNYWDWRTSWFIPERELPHDWFYFENTHTNPFPGFHNEGAQFKPNNDAAAARPIYQINNLTSDFNYQLAWLYRAGELNLPVKYVELGEEFYLNDEHYKERYKSSYDYIGEANNFTNELKSISPFENVQVAVVGASGSDNSPGRRSLWMETILEKISVSANHPDAITIHEYYNSGIGSAIFLSNIGKMFNKAFQKGSDLLTGEIQAIKNKNISASLTPPLEAWITEYNMNDDVSNNVGTWAHGLFNAIQTLKFLESPLITHVSSHAMTSDAVFGNIFASIDGFSGLATGQLPYNITSGIQTTQFGFTASGAAMNEIALAMRGTNVTAHRIDFSNDATAIGTISYAGQPGPGSYLNLYGWSFEKEEGFEAIILNLGIKTYQIMNPCSLVNFTSGSNCPQSLVRLTSNEPTAGITNVTNTGSLKVKDLNTTDEIAITGSTIEIAPYSLTRIIYRNPTTVTVRLTDDVICENSETSVLVQGGTFGAPCTLNISGNTPIILSDSLFLIGNNLSANTYSITATVDGITSDPVTLTVHPAISVEASITSGNTTPCADVDITLSATVNSTNTNSNLSHSYSYLWVPDGEIIDHNPFQQSIIISNSNLKTNAYQVFVYDEYCWASSNLIEFDRGPVSVDLGKDFTICSDGNFDLRALTTTSPLITNGTLHYRLLQNGSELVPDQTASADFTITALSVGTYTYRVEVWSENGTQENKDCPIADEVIVNVVNCCSCSADIALTPSPHGTPDNPINNYASEFEMINGALDPSYGFTVNPSTGDAQTVTITGSNISKAFCINGEFWVRHANLGTKVLETLILENCTLRLGPDANIVVRAGVKLILRGCFIESCDGVHMWDGIYADITDQSQSEPELEITDLIISSISNRTQIRNAKNAIVARRESPFLIENCDFLNNYVDIKIEKYNKNNLNQSATIIRNCTFSKTSTLLDPHAADIKFAAIALDDVEGRTIGDATGGANEISNSLYGIYSHNASVTVLNTDFHDIWDNASPHLIGSCIYSSSDYDFNNRNITLGDGSSAGANTFSSSMNGLTGIGEMNYYIYSNTFGNGTLADRLLENCIGISNNGSKEIVIQDQNQFYDYRHGIDIAAPRGMLHILNNTFGNAYFSSTTNFDGTAVNVYGVYPVKLYGSEIRDNTIGASSGSIQSRIGIRLSQIHNVKIATNTINFHQGSIPTDPYVGIWVENSNETKIVDINEVENRSGLAAGSVNMLTGLKLDQSAMSCIEQNIFTELGYGMNISGNSIVSSLYQNQFSEFDAGIHFNQADIGPRVGTQNSTIPSNGNVMGNLWSCTSCGSTTNNRINGSKNNNLPLFWFTPTNTTSDSDFPDNSVSGGLLTPFYLSGTTTEDSECPLPASPSEEDNGLPINLRTRNETFGSVVADTCRYPEDYQAEFRYMARQMAFGILKKNPNLIELDDDSDTSFVSFYNETLVSNINKIDSLENLLAKRLFVAGDTLLNHFTDTNSIEHNYKRVYRLYIKQQLYGDTSLTETDWDELNAIAYEHPLTGGKAVLAARNMLKLEIHDEELSSSRVMNSNQQGADKKLLIYPNPASNSIHIHLAGAENVNTLLITDITGRVMLMVTDADTVNTSLFAQGIYFVRVTNDGKNYFGSFIITR